MLKDSPYNKQRITPGKRLGYGVQLPGKVRDFQEPEPRADRIRRQDIPASFTGGEGRLFPARQGVDLAGQFRGHRARNGIGAFQNHALAAFADPEGTASASVKAQVLDHLDRDADGVFGNGPRFRRKAQLSKERLRQRGGELSLAKKENAGFSLGFHA
jgi:hypothetical protein